MNYRIMSFNVNNLSLGSEAEKLNIIAKIILDNDVDIVAMQEVLSEGKILTGTNLKSVSGSAKAYEHSLKKRLGKNWAMCWRNPKTWAKNYAYLGNDKRGEGYAFLWNTDRVNLLEEDGATIYPRIYRNYRTNVAKDLIRLIRDPCYGQFKINGRPVEIRLLTTHIVYGKPSNSKISADLDYGAVTMRKNEFQILAGQIYPSIAQFHKQTTCTSAYTIILGDYNLNIPSSGVDRARLPEVLCFDERGIITDFSIAAPTVINTVQSNLTTINADGDALANNYDHFSYDNRTASVVPDNGVQVVDPADYINVENGSTLGTYKEKVSDHLPIIITLEI